MAKALIASPRSPNGVTLVLNALLELGVRVFRTDRGPFWQDVDDTSVVTDHEYTDLLKHLPVFGRTREFWFKEDIAVEWSHRTQLDDLHEHHVILMTRDPRDALYSWWRRMKNAGFNAYGIVEAPAPFIEYIQRGSEYLPGHEGLDRIDDHVLYYRTVLEHADQFKSFSVLRFEDVKSQPMASMLSVLAQLQLKRPLQAVREAIAASDVSVARKVEAMAGTVPAIAAVNSHQVNFKGQAYEWEQNSAERLAYALITSKTRELCELFGYRTSLDSGTDGAVTRAGIDKWLRSGTPLRLHIGGTQRKDGWQIFNIQSSPDVDFIGNCTDLSAFPDNSVAAIYASHVLEHVSHAEIVGTLREWHRVLAPNGEVLISVPDLEVVSQLLVHPQAELGLKNLLMRTLYGGQEDTFDFHKTGFTAGILAAYLERTGFHQLERVQEFGLFDDYSAYRMAGNLISLNVRGRKP
ncbi:MAG: methyltransferase domain-containing protein [Gammaproteobacteria bacterium]|nr:methyltransferase domain-containing protein [Gammaproteobacteria bacterium]